MLAGCNTVGNPSRLSSKGSGKASCALRGASSATIMSQVHDESDFHTHSVSWIPKSNAASSERIKAAHVAAQVHTEASSKKNKKRKIRRSKMKSLKQRAHLLHVEVPDNVTRFTHAETVENSIYVDGGDCLNPRISPKVPVSSVKPAKPKSVKPEKPKPVKPLIVLSVVNEDLYVPTHHLMDPTKGLTIFMNKNPTNKPKSFVLCPRKICMDQTAQLNN